MDCGIISSHLREITNSRPFSISTASYDIPPGMICWRSPRQHASLLHSVTAPQLTGKLSFLNFLSQWSHQFSEKRKNLAPTRHSSKILASTTDLSQSWCGKWRTSRRSIGTCGSWFLSWSFPLNKNLKSLFWLRFTTQIWINAQGIISTIKDWT